MWVTVCSNFLFAKWNGFCFCFDSSLWELFTFAGILHMLHVTEWHECTCAMYSSATLQLGRLPTHCVTFVRILCKSETFIHPLHPSSVGQQIYQIWKSWVRLRGMAPPILLFLTVRAHSANNLGTVNQDP